MPAPTRSSQSMPQRDVPVLNCLNNRSGRNTLQAVVHPRRSSTRSTGCSPKVGAQTQSQAKSADGIRPCPLLKLGASSERPEIRSRTSTQPLPYAQPAAGRQQLFTRPGIQLLPCGPPITTKGSSRISRAKSAVLAARSRERAVGRSRKQSRRGRQLSRFPRTLSAIMGPTRSATMCGMRQGSGR